MATFLYARVSTIEQDLRIQIMDARKAGFDIMRDNTICDEVSGLTTRLCERQNGKRLYDLLRSGDVLVVRWLDRLGRNYDDVCQVMRDFLARGVTIKTIINGMTFDGSDTDPMRKAIRDALIAFMAAMAQAEVEVRKAAQKSGIARAKGELKYRGRKPTYTAKQLIEIKELLATGTGVSEIAKAYGLNRATIYRIKNEPEQMESAARAWEGII